jgi:ribose transport system permease protein
VLLLSVLDSIFNQLSVDPFFKNVVRGVVIIAAVALYARPFRRRAKERDAARAEEKGALA